MSDKKYPTSYEFSTNPQRAKKDWERLLIENNDDIVKDGDIVQHIVRYWSRKKQYHPELRDVLDDNDELAVEQILTCMMMSRGTDKSSITIGQAARLLNEQARRFMRR